MDIIGRIYCSNLRVSLYRKVQNERGSHPPFIRSLANHPMTNHDFPTSGQTGPDDYDEAYPPSPKDWETTGAPSSGKETLEATTVYCVQCGYNLTGVAIGSKCPECGRTVAPSFHSQTLPTSGKAVASMVLGICSIFGCGLYGLPSIVCGPLAIIFSVLAKKSRSVRARSTPPHPAWRPRGWCAASSAPHWLC